MTNKYDTIKNDFSDFEEILSNPDHVVRRHYRCFMDGSYGMEYYNKYSQRWADALLPYNGKRLRSIIIQSFCEYNAIDCDLTQAEVQRWLVKNIGIDNLEKLNHELMDDVRSMTE